MTRGAIWGAVLVGAALVVFLRFAPREDPAPRAGGPAAPLVGQQAPAFRLPELSGGEAALAEQQGKIVILDFWATWCGPCRRSMPILDKLGQQDPELVVLAINLRESDDDVLKYVARTSFRSRVLLDRDGTVGRAYGVRSMPMQVIIDRRGEVRDVQIGFTPRMDERIRETIARLKSSGS